MKNIFYIIVLLLFTIQCQSRQKTNVTIDDFVGQWSYVSDEDVFILNLEKINDNEVLGSYNSVQYNGTRIDAGVDQEKNITGVFKADTLYLKFTGFYDLKARGEAKLYKDGDTSLVWVLGKYQGEFYLPIEAAIKRPSSSPGGIDCNDKLSLLITSSLNYVTDQDLNLLKAVIDRQDKNLYSVRLYNKSTGKDVSFIKLDIDKKTLIDCTDRDNETMLEYEEVFYNSVLSCLGLKAIDIKTERKEVDPKLMQRFETYYNQAPFYKTSNEITDEDDGEMMEISSDMCNFFNIVASKLYLWKFRTHNEIKLCLLYAEITPDDGFVIFYTLSADNKIIDKLPMKSNCDDGLASEYIVDYIDGENIICTDKTNGQRGFDKKKYCINSAGRFEEIEE